MPPNPDSPGRTLAAICIAFQVVFILLLNTTRLAHASPEYIQSEQTAAGSVDESAESSEHAFKLPAPHRVFAKLGDVLSESSLNLHLRNYYFSRARDADPTIET